MSRNARLITALLGILLVLLIAVPAYWYKSMTASAGLENILASQLSTQLGRHVGIGSVQVKPTGQIIAQAVTVEDQGQILLQAPEMTVSYNILYIFTQKPLTGLRSVTFQQAELFFDRHAATGEWNIIQFIKEFKKPEGDGGFRAVIRLVDSTIHITEQQQSTMIEQVNGEFDFTGSPNVSLLLSGFLADQPLTAKGSVHTGNSTFGIQIDAQNQSLEMLVPWLPQTELTEAQGTFDVSVFLLQEQYQPLRFSGEIDLKDINARLRQNDYQLTNITGKVLLNNNALFLLGLTSQLNGEIFRVQGNVALDGRSPYLDVTVAADDVNVKNALPDKEIPVDGNIQLELSVVGSMDDLRVHGVVGMKQGVIKGIELYDGTAVLTYYNGWLDVHDLQAGVLGGTIQGQGVVKLGVLPVYTALLRLDGVQSPSSELTGEISASIFVTGNEQNMVSTIWGAGQLQNGVVYSVPFDKAETGFYWADNQLQLNYCNVSIGNGWFLVSGSSTQDNINLALQGENIPLERLSPAMGNLAISGIGALKGEVHGSLADPFITGIFTVKQGQVLQQSIAECTGEFSLTTTELALHNVAASHGETQHSLNGSIYFSPESALNLHVVSKHAPAEEVAKLLHSNEKIRGLIDNEVVVQGSLQHPVFEGRMLLKEGLYRDQLIDQAQVDYRYRNDILELTNCTVVSGAAILELTGTLGQQQELDFRFAARNLQFAELNALQELAEISGRAELSGTIQGVWENPRIISSVNAYDTVINKQRFGNLSGQLEFVNKQLIVSELHLSDEAARYDFLGKIDFNDTPQIEGQLTVRDGQVPQLLGLLSYAMPDTQGKVTADLTLSGALHKPDARGQLTVTEGYVRGFPVDIIELDVVAEQGIITFNSFELKQGQGFMRAQGTWVMDGVLALEVGGKNLDASFVAALLPDAQPVKGTMSFTAQIAGTIQNPQAALSVEIKQGSWANAEFDSLYALALLDNNIVKLNQIMLAKGPYRASAYGTVPLAALTTKGRQEPNSASGMDIRVQLEQADLSILPLLSKNVTWAVGQTHGEVHISGNLAQPFINGRFTVTDGTVKIRGMNNPVEQVNVNLEFDGDQIQLKTFTGQIGGGTYTGSGSAVLKGFSLSDLRMQLKLDRLYVNSSYYVGSLDGDFTLEEVRGLPFLKGNLQIVNAEISPPVFWPTGDNALPNVRLDVEIGVDKNVRLRNSALYDMYVTGKVKAQGTLHNPITSGRLTVLRGNLQYLGTSFKISEGVADFNQYDSFLPSIRVVAETRTLDTKVRLQANGPLSQMEFILSSEPPLSQQQIITLLTLRSRRTSGANGTADTSGSDKDQLVLLLNQGLQFTFVQRVEKVFENFLGLDEFHIARSQNEGVTDKEMYNLEVGKFINDKIFLGYTLGIDQTERAFRFRYDITNHLSVDGEFGGETDKRLGVEARFYF